MSNSKYIAHFTSELNGGAGVAAQRLHNALRRDGADSSLYFNVGSPFVAGCERAFQNRSFFWRNVAALAESWRHRRSAPDAFVTSPRWIRKTRLSEFNRQPDVVNLHWVSRWLDLPSFFASIPSGLPVVWSLHDMNPLTGGCHHAGECESFTSHCGLCPQLRRPGRRDNAYRFFETKARAYTGKNLHVVGNSLWTTAQARRSALMRHAKTFHTIPLGLDIAQFKLVDRNCARKALGIDEKRFVVGFACADFKDPNKGGPLLIEALRGLPRETGTMLLAFGSGRLPQVDPLLEIVELGTLNSPRLQSLFYSATDVFAAPSRVESFGLTALEAMACGAPVVAFRTSGLAEVVADGETGLLEDEVGNVEGLTRKLHWLLQHPAERQSMRFAARQRVETHFTDTSMAKRYIELYRELISSRDQPIPR